MRFRNRRKGEEPVEVTQEAPQRATETSSRFPPATATAATLSISIVTGWMAGGVVTTGAATEIGHILVGEGTAQAAEKPKSKPTPIDKLSTAPEQSLRKQIAKKGYVTEDEFRVAYAAKVHIAVEANIFVEMTGNNDGPAIDAITNSKYTRQPWCSMVLWRLYKLVREAADLEPISQGGAKFAPGLDDEIMPRVLPSGGWQSGRDSDNFMSIYRLGAESGRLLQPKVDKKKKRPVRMPKKGDFVLMDTNTGRGQDGHAAMLASINANGNIITIEGNTSGDMMKKRDDRGHFLKSPQVVAYFSIAFSAKEIKRQEQKRLAFVAKHGGDPTPQVGPHIAALQGFGERAAARKMRKLDGFGDKVVEQRQMRALDGFGEAPDPGDSATPQEPSTPGPAPQPGPAPAPELPRPQISQVAAQIPAPSPTPSGTQEEPVGIITGPPVPTPSGPSPAPADTEVKGDSEEVQVASDGAAFPKTTLLDGDKVDSTPVSLLPQEGATSRPVRALDGFGQKAPQSQAASQPTRLLSPYDQKIAGIYAQIPEDILEGIHEEVLPKMENKLDNYRKIGNKYDIHPAVLAAIHWRECEADDKKSPVEGEEYGTKGEVSGISVKNLEMGLTVVFGKFYKNYLAFYSRDFGKVKTDPQAIKEGFLRYNRGHLYSDALKAGKPDATVEHSPYAVNGLTPEKTNMHWTDHESNRPHVRKDLAGKEDGNKYGAFTVFVVLHHENILRLPYAQ